MRTTATSTRSSGWTAQPLLSPPASARPSPGAPRVLPGGRRRFKILAPVPAWETNRSGREWDTMPDEMNDGATTVLVVEDDFDLRDALVPILEYEGHRVVSAANGKEALERLRTMPPPSLILLDLMMPVMDGEQFRAQQLRDPALASIPVVVVSAHASAEERAALLGAAGCVKKPFEIEDLLEQVRRSSRSPVAAAPTPSATRLPRR